MHRMEYGFAAATILLLMSLKAAGESPEGQYGSLAEELEGFSKKFGIALTGVEKTRSAPPKALNLQSPSQIRLLLAGYNYFLIESDNGRIERIIILERLAPLPDRIVLSTEKEGERHTIPVLLTGNGGERTEIRLMVDTGADFVVLPESMMASLGFDGEALESREMQTANGMADAKVGTLPALEIGSEIIENVDVAFIRDELLGNTKLIGMRALSRFRITIDDDKREITLIKNQ